MTALLACDKGFKYKKNSIIVLKQNYVKKNIFWYLNYNNNLKKWILIFFLFYNKKINATVEKKLSHPKTPTTHQNAHFVWFMLSSVSTTLFKFRKFQLWNSD